MKPGLWLLLAARLLSGAVAEVNGTKLYYEVQGQGRPVVLIHGGLLDGRMWDDQVPRFAARYRVIRYDVRRFGRSTVATGPYLAADDLRALLDFLNEESTT